MNATAEPSPTHATKKQLYTDPANKPAVLAVDPDGIPNDMKARRQWVLWKLVWRDDAWAKVPGRADGRKAKSNDPATWDDFAPVLARYRQGGYDGIGYVLNGEPGIDLDNVRDPETGDIHPAARRLIEAAGTYTDISPSGTGAKLFGFGRWAGGWHKRPIPRAPGADIEVYDAGRYFCVTGHRVGDHADRADITAVLTQLATDKVTKDDKKRGTRQPPQDRSGGTKSEATGNTLTDEDVLLHAAAADNGQKFLALWNGSDNYHDGDTSRADLALCVMLAFWTGKDAKRIDDLFRKSKRSRDKWDRKARAEDGATYGRVTIEKAIELTTETYRPGPRAVFGDGGKAPTGQTPAGNEPDQPTTGAAIILDYFRTRYRPAFRVKNDIVTPDGETVTKAMACEVPTSKLIARLKAAADAPRFKGGGLNEGSLPQFFRNWAGVAWGDLLDTLPDEDTAQLGADGPAGEEFRRLVGDAMRSEVVLGDVIGKEGTTQTERRSLIDWCQRFAKPGPWRRIRSKECWCKTVVDADTGEVVLRVAVRHGLFGQMRADRRLVGMRANTFGKRCERYAVGTTPRDDRPHGQRAVVLSDDFVRELTAGLADHDTAPEGDSPEG